MTFNGYLRPNGSVGIRNHVICIPTVFCCNGAVEGIARKVPGVIGLTHSDGCDTKRIRTPYFWHSLVNLCRNPNNYAVILVTLGCEPENSKEIAKMLEAEGINVFARIVQQDGGGEKVIEEGAEAARVFLAEAKKQKRVEVPLSKLILGLETPAMMKREDRMTACAGSQDEEEDALKATDYVAKWVVDHGGSAILPCVYRYNEHLSGDKRPIQTMGFSELVGDRKGFFVIDQDGPRFKGPKHGFFTLDPGETFMSQISSGAQMALFASGRTLPLGFPSAPILKYCSDFSLSTDVAVEDADIAGPFTEKTGEKCVQAMLDVLNGKKTDAEEANGADDLLGFLRRTNWY